MKFLRLAFVGIAILTLSGCSLQPPPPTPTDNTAPLASDSSPVNSTTGNNKKIVLKWSGAFLTSADIKPLINAYTSANPNVEIDYTQEVIAQKDISNYRSKLNDIIVTGNTSTPPDIFMIDKGWSGIFAPYLQPAPSNIIGPNDLKNNFYDFVSSDFVINNNVYGVPLWVDTLAMIYNKKLWQTANLTEPNSDWHKFVTTQAVPLTLSTNGKITQSGFGGGLTKNNEFWFDSLNMFLMQNGVNLVDANNQAVFAENPKSADAISFYQQFSTGTNKTWDNTFNQDVAAFLEGKLATYLAPSWRLNDIVKYNNLANLGLNIGISEVPQLQSSNSIAKADFADYWGNVVNKKSANSDAAWKFLAFITQPAQLQLLNQTAVADKTTGIGLLYPRKDMTTQQTGDANLGVYAKSLNYAKSWQMVDSIEIKTSFATILDSNSDLKTVETSVNATLAKLHP